MKPEVEIINQRTYAIKITYTQYILMNEYVNEYQNMI